MQHNLSRDAEMLALRQQGLTFRDIGKRMGVCYQTVQRVLSRAERMQKEQEAAEQLTKILPIDEMPVKDFLILNNASTRLFHALRMNNYQIVSDVLKDSAARFVRLPGIGKKSVEELEGILKKHGLQLKS